MQINEQSSLDDCLAYLASLNQNKIELGLDRVLTVANRLDLCNFSCKVVTIAGTNGKGTCIETMRRVLNKLDWNVGVYTSPHIFDFRERVQINTNIISAADCCACMYAIYQHLAGQYLSYFEFTTLMALYYFKLQDQQGKLDIILLEIGLGGRLDAVNIVKNNLAIITSIGLDHCDYLGDSKLQIAYEKAAIIKANNLVICGEAEVTLPFINQAKMMHAQLQLIDLDYSYTMNADLSWSFNLHNKVQLHNLPVSNFPYQNIATAFTALSSLVPEFWQQLDVYQIIPSLALLGRMMQFTAPGPVRYIVDCAHNPAAAVWLANKCAQHVVKAEIIFGCCSDKDARGMLDPFFSLATKWHLVEFNSPRSSTALELSKLLNNQNVNLYTSVTTALEQVTAPYVIIYGSFYMVAEALEFLMNSLGNKHNGY